MAGKMLIDSLGRVSFNSKDLIEEIYKGNIDKISQAAVDIKDEDYQKYIEFVTENALSDWPVPQPVDTESLSQEEFDKSNQSIWYMPQEYRDMDIEAWLVEQCPKENYDRLVQELILFQERDMIMMLRYLKFLVDTMRHNNILWGVGRGSSVASYCLYLIGIHKIDSIKYDLDIKEFLR
jgi:DNA polymerase III alpha subunit